MSWEVFNNPKLSFVFRHFGKRGEDDYFLSFGVKHPSLSR